MGRRRAHARLAWEGAAKTGVAERPEPRTGRAVEAGDKRRFIRRGTRLRTLFHATP